MKTCKALNNPVRKLRWTSVLVLVLLNWTNLNGQIGQPNHNLCQLNFRKYYSNAMLYKGTCQNGMANGWGQIEWDSGLKIEGYFINDKIQNSFIKLTYSDGVGFFPNNGIHRHGPGVFISKQNEVQAQSMLNDEYSSTDWKYAFSIEQLQPIKTEPFCLNLPASLSRVSYTLHTDIVQIPGTSTVIIEGNEEVIIDGPQKRWLVVVDIDSNKVIMRIGSRESPLVTSLSSIKFLGYDYNNHPTYSYGQLGDVIKINVFKKQVTRLKYADLQAQKNQLFRPSSLTNCIEHSLNISENGRLESGHFKELSKISRSGYKLTFSNLVNGTGRIFLQLNDSIILNHEFNNMLVKDAVLNERTMDIAVSLDSKDSTFLTYLSANGETVNFFKAPKQNNLWYSRLDFSPNYTYLLVFGSDGDVIYLGTDLYYAIPKELEYIGMSRNEKILITDEYIFDVESRRVMNRFASDKILICQNKFYTFNKMSDGVRDLRSYKIPEPLVEFSNFQIRQEEVVSGSSEPILATSTTNNSNSSTNSEVDEGARLAYLFWLLQTSAKFQKIQKEYNLYTTTQCVQCGKTWDYIVDGSGFKYRKQCATGGYCEVIEASDGKFCSEDCALQYCKKANVSCGDGFR